MKTFTVITDPGIDDLIALLLLYKLAPQAKNSVISTFGNIPEKLSFQNAREFIGVVKPAWNLMRGAQFPLSGKLEHQWLYNFHGPDGVWNHHTQTNIGKVKIVKHINKISNIISLASLTDLYKILEENKKTMKTITIMGGAFNDKGNHSEFAECNIAFDPQASQQFFSAATGIDIKVVPLDVTRKVCWTDKIVKNIPESSQVNRWIKQILLTWYREYFPLKKAYFKMHDPLAVYLTYFPENAIWKESGVEVILKGKKRGKTEFVANKPICKIALDLKDPDKISKDIFKIAFN